MKCRLLFSSLLALSCKRFSTMTSKAHSHHNLANVLIPIADGSEELEAVAMIDILVRGGAHVVTASVSPSIEVTCSRGVKILADIMIADAVHHSYDLIACPGGMPGANHLRDSSVLSDLLLKQQSEGKFIGAICASPAVVLHPLNLLHGKRATCYPAESFTSHLTHYVNEPVVVDGHLITSQGPGTAIPFALKLVELVISREAAEKVAKELLLHHK